jgi:hypothetical protein
MTVDVRQQLTIGSKPRPADIGALMETQSSFP